MNSNTKDAEGRHKIKIERSYRAPLEDVWQPWTTKKGITRPEVEMAGVMSRSGRGVR